MPKLTIKYINTIIIFKELRMLDAKNVFIIFFATKAQRHKGLQKFKKRAEFILCQTE